MVAKEKVSEMMDSPDTVDKDLAVESTMGLMFSDEGVDSLLQAAQGGNDPVAVAAKAVFAALSRVRQEFKGQDMALSDDVFLGEDGAAAEILVMVFKLFEKQLGFKWGDAEFNAAMDLIEEDAKMLLSKEANAPPPGQQAAPPQRAPASGPPGLGQTLGGM